MGRPNQQDIQPFHPAEQFCIEDKLDFQRVGENRQHLRLMLSVRGRSLPIALIHDENVPGVRLHLSLDARLTTPEQIDEGMFLSQDLIDQTPGGFFQIDRDDGYPVFIHFFHTTFGGKVPASAFRRFIMYSVRTVLRFEPAFAMLSQGFSSKAALQLFNQSVSSPLNN